MKSGTRWPDCARRKMRDEGENDPGISGRKMVEESGRRREEEKRRGREGGSGDKEIR